MGLDMYLTKEIYVGANYDWNNVKGKIEITQNDKKLPIDLSKVTYIVEHVGYWRKANAIHKWFVDNVQNGVDDCREYDVDIGQLKQLLGLCNSVIKKVKYKNELIEVKNTPTEDGCIIEYKNKKVIKNPEELSKILPTTSGFFFGNTEYDEYYIEDIYSTIGILENAIKDFEKAAKDRIIIDFKYRSSW